MKCSVVVVGVGGSSSSGYFTRGEWVELLSAIAIKAPFLLLLFVAKGRRIGQWGSSEEEKEEEEEEVGKERDRERQRGLTQE